MRRFLLAICLPLAACSREAPTASSTSDGTGPRIWQDFGDWCADWQLTCPTGGAVDVPSAGDPWSRERWRHFFGAMGAVASADVDVRVTAAELAQPAWRSLFGVVSAEPLLDALVSRSRDSGLIDLQVGGGRIHATTNGTGQVRGGSGLFVQTGADVAMTITERGDVGVTGIGLSSSHVSTPEELTGFAISGTNVLELSARSGLGVVDMPIAFLLEEAMGMPLSAVRLDEDIGYRDLAGSMLPMKSLLTSGHREIDVGPATFRELAEHVPQMVDGEELRGVLQAFLGRIQSLKSTAASRGSRLVSGRASEEITCVLNEEAALTIERDFGVESIEAVNGALARVSLYGVRAKPLRGLVRPSIRMHRVDLEANRVVIRDVPVIGSYAVELTEGQDVTIRCD